ncbi:MAG: tetraacyldisaccharide 4'-kinase [Pseudomonadota bacterium]
MRRPLFWYRPPGLISALLSPLSMIRVRRLRRRLAAGARARVPVPVICIGDLVAGGAGKTPAAIAMAGRLMDHGFKPHAIVQPDGINAASPLRVSEHDHRADEVGDEPLLLSAFIPTWICGDHHAAAQAALAAGADAILLDGGFRDASLHHDLSILVVDARRGLGNGKVMPAGPLKEPLTDAVARADILLSVGPDRDQEAFDAAWPGNTPLLHVRGVLRPLPTGLPLHGMPVVAFAGIGHPQKFFATLADMGADIRAAHALLDHQPLHDALITRLRLEAKTLGAQLVTTEKDAVRLPPRFRSEVTTVPVRLDVQDWAPFDARLASLRQTPA